MPEQFYQFTPLRAARLTFQQMKTDVTQINLVIAWLWILLGFVSGMVLGMFFRGETWLGGYASFKRRMYRLGHISFFGLGAVNLLFCLTVKNFALTGEAIHYASLAFVVGAISMPLCCVVMANWPKAHMIFSIPVVSLLVGGALMLTAIVRAPKNIPSVEGSAVTINQQITTKNSP